MIRQSIICILVCLWLIQFCSLVHSSNVYLDRDPFSGHRKPAEYANDDVTESTSKYRGPSNGGPPAHHHRMDFNDDDDDQPSPRQDEDDYHDDHFIPPGHRYGHRGPGPNFIPPGHRYGHKGHDFIPPGHRYGHKGHDFIPPGHRYQRRPPHDDRESITICIPEVVYIIVPCTNQTDNPITSTTPMDRTTTTTTTTTEQP
ncbi:uncharacterized protein LOC124498303 isoform X1 [Dermatophagoides farinae]|uniref:uncharacterized protein LOC124498303 isoform X1 n=1 Tax=Dermatophagoides farinae TaxID=6954 RepID=UPI003F5D91FA